MARGEADAEDPYEVPPVLHRDHHGRVAFTPATVVALQASVPGPVHDGRPHRPRARSCAIGSLPAPVRRYPPGPGAARPAVPGKDDAVAAPAASQSDGDVEAQIRVC